MKIMKRITTAVLVFVAAAPLSSGCAAPPGTVSEKRTVATDSTPAKSAVCGMSDTPAGPQPIFYVYSAMNHKLGHFPELARAVGLDAVTDCESAERYVEGYTEFAAQHPDFDLEEPLVDLAEVEDPEAPDGPSGKLEGQKILGGIETLNNPVVGIHFDPKKQGGKTISDGNLFGFRGRSCSGTFIAKNWILTAAHCITTSAVYHCIKDGINPILNNVSNPACRPALPNYGQWQITFELPDGTLRFMTDTWALAYVNPAWVGTDPRKDPALNPGLKTDGGVGRTIPGFSDNDVALLYLGDDGILPPRVEDDGAKRLNIVAQPNFSSWSMQALGWGDPGTEFGFLRTTGPNGMTLTLSDNGRHILGSSNSMQGSPCPGDSGGPLLRMNTSIRTNKPPSPRSIQIIVGVNSTGTHEANCENNTIPTGTRTSTYANVSHESNFSFIEGMIRRWNGNPITKQSGFKCRTRPVEGEGTVHQLAECWGFPCTSNLDCDTENSGMVCSRAGRDYTACVTCDLEPEPACNCIVGQCLPDPRKATPP